MKISSHAKARMQQRGVSQRVLEDLLDYGQHRYEKGADIYFGSKNACQDLLSQGRRAKHIERLTNVYVVVLGQVVATVAHRI